MFIRTLFTPEIALLFFAFLVLFFVSISFPSRKTILIIMVAYLWRLCAFALADISQMAQGISAKNMDFILMGIDSILAIFLYWLLKRMAFAQFERMPWFVALCMNCLAAGLFISSLFLLFPLEMGSVFPKIGTIVFATPLMNALWLFAPLGVLGILHAVPKKVLQKKLKIK